MAILYQTMNMADATLRVALVPRADADLLVHRVATPGLAHGDAHWFITRSRSDATSLVHFTSLGMAQLTVCFVASHGEAGWQKPRPHSIRL